MSDSHSDMENIYSPNGRRKPNTSRFPETFTPDTPGSTPNPSLSLYKKEYQMETRMEGSIDTNKQPSSIPLSAQHLKISIRLPKGIVTSLTLKKNIIALWLLYTYDASYIDLDAYFASDNTSSETQKKLKDKISKMVTDFVYKCLDKWKKESGRGLSDFITEMMIEDFLDDYSDYEELLPLI